MCLVQLTGKKQIKFLRCITFFKSSPWKVVCLTDKTFLKGSYTCNLQILFYFYLFIFVYFFSFLWAFKIMKHPTQKLCITNKSNDVTPFGGRKSTNKTYYYKNYCHLSKNSSKSSAIRQINRWILKRARQIFRKTIISYLLIRTRACAYQGVRNVRFSDRLTGFVFL